MVGSNAFNQVEKDLDALMDRTKTVQFLRMSVFQHWLLSVLIYIVGITLLYMINPKTAMFGAISIFLYTSVYTVKNGHIIIRFVCFPELFRLC
jgi:protoheme IX farnesyltransferase